MQNGSHVDPGDEIELTVDLNRDRARYTFRYTVLHDAPPPSSKCLTKPRGGHAKRYTLIYVSGF